MIETRAALQIVIPIALACVLTLGGFIWMMESTEARWQEQEKTAPFKSFKLSSGEVVSCRWIEAMKCGAFLKYCTNGSTYTCLTNVEQVKP